MTDDLVQPITERPAPTAPPYGRTADLIATLIATLGAILTVTAALWFFLGFLENDKRLEHLTSAFVLTLGLFSFAVAPFAIVAEFGRRAYRTGAKPAHLLWTIFLMLPWIVLGVVTATHTPLPIWCGIGVSVLAVILTLWALVSYALDRVQHTDPQNLGPELTALSHENEVSDAVK